MKTFRTDVSPGRSNELLGLKNPVLTAGSCFADAIGKRLQRYKFPVMVNPFGATYNPHSIHKSILYAVSNQTPAEHTFLQNQGIFLNYDFHSTFSGTDRTSIGNKLLNTIGSVHYFLKNAKRILITYGTSWVYERQDTTEIVANCHKLPSKNFKKRLLSESEIAESFQGFQQQVLKFNPQLDIILTVSPVRHLKDTLELNSVSKAVLRSACHQIVTRFQKVEYFPAYEIMMDDLRDYRFYKSDMIHPTEDAEDYIWEKFTACYIDDDTRSFMKQWDAILAAIRHKPFHPSSLAHQVFLKDTLRKLQELKVKVDVEEEMRHIQSQLVPA